MNTVGVPGPSSAAILKSSLMTLLLVSATTVAVGNTAISVVVEVLLVDAILVAEVITVAVSVAGCSKEIKTVPSSSDDDIGKRLLRFLNVLLL